MFREAFAAQRNIIAIGSNAEVDRFQSGNEYRVQHVEMSKLEYNRRLQARLLKRQRQMLQGAMLAGNGA